MTENMTRILVISDAGSVWTRNFVQYILHGPKYKVAVFDTHETDEASLGFYRELDVDLFRFPDSIRNTRKNGKSSILGKAVQALRSRLFLRRVCKDFDFVNMQFVWFSLYRQLKYVHEIDRKLILSFWGSDLLRRSDDEIRELSDLVHRVKCKRITFDNGDLKNTFDRHIPGQEDQEEVVMLPLPSLDAIDRTRNDGSGQIGEYKLPENKILVAIGYNASPAQQHIEVIKALGMLSEEIRKRFVIILQMTYAGAEDYKKECEKCCRENGIDCITIREFMSEEQVGRLRNRVDVFVNAQTTDAFSGSFCEYLYANTVVFNAKWLHYDEIDRYGISCVEFDDFEMLSRKIEMLINSPETISVNKEKNKKIIYELRSVESCREKWNRIFTA